MKSQLHLRTRSPVVNKACPIPDVNLNIPTTSVPPGAHLSWPEAAELSSGEGCATFISWLWGCYKYFANTLRYYGFEQVATVKLLAKEDTLPQHAGLCGEAQEKLCTIDLSYQSRATAAGRVAHYSRGHLWQLYIRAIP